MIHKYQSNHTHPTMFLTVEHTCQTNAYTNLILAQVH